MWSLGAVVSEAKNFSRRDFLKFSSTALVTGVASLPDFAAAAGGPDDDESRVRNFGFSILQGLTTNDSTQLTVDVPKGMKVSYRLIDSETAQVMNTYYQRSVVRNYSPWRVDKLGYEGLRCPCRYIFQVLDEKGKILDERFLKTLDLYRQDIRAGLVSCMLDWSPSKSLIWKSLKNAKPDILFFLGDNVYGDLGLNQGPALLWSRYITTRRMVPLYRFKELIPVIATWDDHDFGANNAGGRYRHKVNSAETFKSFFAQVSRAGVLEEGPGISSILKAFGQQFVFTDNRTQRSLPSIHGHAFLGEDQMGWVTKNLISDDGPVWIMQGTQTFGANNNKEGQSYERSFEGEFDDWRAKLRSLNVPVIFTSGDVHFSEVMELDQNFLGFDTVELTSSSMHSFWPLKRPTNQRRTQAIWKENFLMVDLKPSQSELVLDLKGVGMWDKTYFTERIVIG
jgi:alkaline phosphatase D